MTGRFLNISMSRNKGMAHNTLQKALESESFYHQWRLPLEKGTIEGQIQVGDKIHKRLKTYQMTC